MRTNTYRCGCGRILGYLPSGAKESCTSCLQVRRQEAIAKAGPQGVRVEVTLHGWPGTHVPESERAAARTQRQGQAKDDCYFAPYLEKCLVFDEAPLTTADFFVPPGPEHDDRLEEARYVMQAWRDAAPVAVLDEAHPIPKRLFDPARFGARKSTARFGGRTPGQDAPGGLGAGLDQAAKHLGLERLSDETDAAFRRRLASAYLAA